MIKLQRYISHIIVPIALGATGCAGFQPTPLSDLDFMDRAQSIEMDGVTVTTTVMTREESRAAFGKKLDKQEVQAVWFDIQNQSDQPLWLMLHSVDPDYFSAREAAALAHGGNMTVAKEIDNYFDRIAIDPYVPAGGQTSGFVFSNLTQGTREVQVRLFGENRLLEFALYVQVPGLRADWQKVDFESLYADDEFVDFDNPLEFRATVEQYLCCTTRKNGTGAGDPINMVVITPSSGSLKTFVKAGWDETEVISPGSSWRTMKSFFSGGEYKYSPISALYLFGRRQDISLQKARDTIHERNHLRLWLSPWRYQGMLVWLGAISRDIGVFWTTRTWNLTSHAIDSEVDEARSYILENLAAARSVQAFGHIRGVGETTREDPKENLLGTPWWTDGDRVVLLLSEKPVPLEQVDLLPWSR
jgi:hypothetical protein